MNPSVEINEGVTDNDSGPSKLFCISCFVQIKKRVQLKNATCEDVLRESSGILPSYLVGPMSDKKKNNKNQISYCTACLVGTYECIQLNEQLKTTQRELVSKLGHFAINVLKRRTQLKTGNQHLNDINHPGKRFIVLDVTDLPLGYKLEPLHSEVITVEKDKQLNVTEKNVGSATTGVDTPQDVLDGRVKGEIGNRKSRRVLDSLAGTLEISSQVVDEDNHSNVTIVGEAAGGVNHQQVENSDSIADVTLTASSTTTLGDKPKRPKGPSRLVKKLKDVDMPKLKRMIKEKASQQLNPDKGKSHSGNYGRRTPKTSEKSSKSDAPNTSKDLHGKNNRHKCYVCGKEFANKRNLVNHSRGHFEKSIACNLCVKVFPYQSALTMHLRTHTREKPFPCSRCEKTFAQKWSAQVHEAKIHRGELPYKCTVCNATFVKAGILKSHKKTHPEHDNKQS